MHVELRNAIVIPLSLNARQTSWLSRDLATGAIHESSIQLERSKLMLELPNSVSRTRASCVASRSGDRMPTSWSTWNTRSMSDS